LFRLRVGDGPLGGSVGEECAVGKERAVGEERVVGEGCAAGEERVVGEGRAAGEERVVGGGCVVGEERVVGVRGVTSTGSTAIVVFSVGVAGWGVAADCFRLDISSLAARQ